MKLLLIHSDYIEYEVKNKAISNPEEIKLKKYILEELLKFFIAVEKIDEKSQNKNFLGMTFFNEVKIPKENRQAVYDSIGE